MKYPFANIALPVPVAQTFTYRIPEELHTKIVPGRVVIVPFGQKVMTGIVMEIVSQAPNVALKSITDCTEIVLHSRSLALGIWISNYYLAPIGESMKLFLPAGLGSISKRTIRLSESALEEILLQQKLSPGQKAILEFLKDAKKMTVQQLQQKTKIRSIYSTLSELQTLRLINVEEEHRSVREKLVSVFTVRHDCDTALLKSSKQQAAWRMLETVTSEVETTQFMRSSGISLSVLKSLSDKGFITFSKISIRRTTPLTMDEETKRSASIILNGEQQHCVDIISASLEGGTEKTFLLHGITGSGKTQVYIEAIRRARALGKGAIVLIPEISLTPQTVKRFQLHFDREVVWMHSRMSDGERSDAWNGITQGKFSVVIGPRSALFAPLPHVGLIIVDEEHEASYKQFDASPRYHARDAAIVRAKGEEAVVILGSATPSLESYANAESGKYTLLTLTKRADSATLPPVRIVNMIEVRKRNYLRAKTTAKTEGKKAFSSLQRSLSAELEDSIRDRLGKKEGVILLQNRRGFAPMLECRDCGHIVQCSRCNVTMTYHSTKKHIRCHYCGSIDTPPTVCPSCHGSELRMQGYGTQRIEEELHLHFPEAKVLRMDLDSTTRKGSHEQLLTTFGEGNADILLGTQMVAKGLDFPRVTLVGVISADTQMMLPDFRSAERTFQLLTQVAGRAGRSTLKGEVVIQTSQPAHYALRHVLDHDFIGFYTEEMSYRQSANYPPLTRIIVIEFKGPKEKDVETLAESFAQVLRHSTDKRSILGPSPAVLSRINNQYRWQIIVKIEKENDRSSGRTRAAIRHAFEMEFKSAQKKNVKIIIDVDPQGIL